MLAICESAQYSDGQVVLNLSTSTINGYPNQVYAYTSYGEIAVPNAGALVNIEQQAQTQVQVIGYENRITDVNLTVNAGEKVFYSNSWYLGVANAGLYMQPRNTANKENAMMGQSTNKVLTDIMDLLVDVVMYLSTIQAEYDVHTHTIPTGETGVPVPLFSTPPTNTISADQTYISGNHNLAITGTYEPK